MWYRITDAMPGPNRVVILQGASWFDAIRDTKPGSCIPECFTCMIPCTLTAFWFAFNVVYFFLLRCLLLRFSNVCHCPQWKQIPDVFPLLAAAHKTLVSKSRESLTTRTLHSELVYNYSGSKHVILYHLTSLLYGILLLLLHICNP